MRAARSLVPPQAVWESRAGGYGAWGTGLGPCGAPPYKLVGSLADSAEGSSEDELTAGWVGDGQVLHAPTKTARTRRF